MTTIERSILRETVLNGGKYFVYKLHSKKKILPGEISRALRILENKNLIQTDGLMVELTEKGKSLAYSAQIGMVESSRKPWRECPAEFKQPQMPINLPYLPNRKKMN